MEKIQNKNYGNKLSILNSERGSGKEFKSYGQLESCKMETVKTSQFS